MLKSVFSFCQVAILLSLWLPQSLASSALAPVVVGEETAYTLSGWMSVYRDETSDLPFTDAVRLYQAGAFEQPATVDPSRTNFGLTSDQIWLALEFSTKAEISERWFFEVAHASLDYVDFYLLEDGEQLAHFRSGDREPFHEKPVRHRNHVFPARLSPDRHYQLFLSVRSAGTLTVPVTLWQEDSLWASDQQTYSALSLYYGVLVALLVYNLFLFFSLRDPLYLTYVGFIACLGVGQAGLSGLTGQFLWPETPWLVHLSPTAGVAAAGVFGALFVHRFLAGTPARLKLGWLMPGLSIAYGVTFLTAILGSYHLAAISVNLISMVLVAGALFLGAVSLLRGEPGARFFVLAWVCFLLGVLVITLHNVGILPSNSFTTNAMLIGSAMEMLLLSLALADRINELQRARVRAQKQALRSRQKVLEVVKENERQLESRVAERTRELEAVNLQLRESQHLLEKQANHDTLTGLANRKLLQDRIMGAKARARRSGESFALVVVDLNKFKQINDTFGHVAGDEVLIAIGNRLGAVPRGSDTVARIGGDEFVLLLEGIHGQDDLDRIETHLARIGDSPIPLSCGTDVRVGLSIGIALYPDDTRDLERLFSLADAAMYRNKQNGKAGSCEV
ncbi:7TM diverse intracellular signaling domain-containing protein [Marinobacter sp.]|uniref:7TM diverse intracellular signaling domain-containing protein n=1 Tax=Marinobacter sp. TaxID=50741 RepID=UPI00356A0988